MNIDTMQMVAFREYCRTYGLDHLFGKIGSKTEARVERMLTEGSAISLEDYRSDKHFLHSPTGDSLSDEDIDLHHEILLMSVDKLRRAYRAFEAGLPPQHPSFWSES